MRIKNPRAVLVYILVFAAVVAVDQATKYLAFATDYGSFLKRLAPVFNKDLFPNPYFAFSLHITGFWMYFIYFVLLALLTIWVVRRSASTSALVKLGYVFIVAGASSNIFDRLALGYVRDFIAVFWGNVFNVADIFIVAGIVLLLVSL